MSTEILDLLLNLFISTKNLLSALSMELIPTLLVLLSNGCLLDKLLTCELLWILLGESHFQWDKVLYCGSIKEILTTMVENSDENLQVVSKLLLSEPLDGKDNF